MSTGTTHRRRPSGPPAAVARPHGGVGRGSSRYAERVSDDLRRGELATAALRLVPAGPLVDIRGDTVPDERVQPGVAGWAGSTPVRVGNAAKGQVQYDGPGLLVEAVSVYVQTDGRFDAATWRLVRELADSVAAEETGQPQPSNGIWEQQDGALLIDGDIG